jgi:hypothetical protein
VAHSPTPSAVRIAARRVGAVKKRGGGVRMVVGGEQDLRPWHVEDATR